MYSMWTRDPEYDFSILYFMPGFSYFNVNRLGRRFVNENNMGSPHNGWHTLLSFDDAIADFDRIPSWGIFDQSCFDAGKLSTSQGDFFECGNFASDLPDSVRDWDGWSQDNKAELERGWILTGATIEELGQKIKEFDPLMDVDTLKATFEEYQGFAAAGKDARFDRAAETMVPLDNGPYYAVSIYPGSCSTLGRSHEERERPGARSGAEPHPAPVRGRLLRQLPEPHLRHHRRQQRREPGVGPHRRPPCLRSGELGRRVALRVRLATAVRARAAGLRPIREENGRLSADR